ncbi:MAG: acetate--CoA ligase family protein [Proteobacteria bacterium]|nr:acetate--CoA ligase family protein [Pseudomonadota bacterium]
MTRDLSRLLNPGLVAVVGGGAWCAGIVDAARRIGYKGRIVPVHPAGKVIAGLQSVPSLADIGAPIDAAFICVNRHATIGVVEELRALGAGGAVCFASGFREAVAESADGGDLQDRLLEAAGDMPVLGPNCYGFVNALDRDAIWPDQHGMQPVERGVAILTQSSNIAINLTMQRRALPIAFMVTCGNQAQTGQAEIARALLRDPRITALGLHIEGFTDLAQWHALAREAAARGVPIVALKSGASEQAQRATVSHTASLAGSDAGAQALIDRLGIARAQDIPTFLETLKLFHLYGRLDAPTVSAISCSGGEASLVADSAVGRDLSFPDLTQDQRTRLRGALGPMVALANPLDYHTYVWRDVAAMTAAWSPMADPHIGMTLAIVDYPHTDATDWECATQAAINVRATTGRPIAMVATLPELMPGDVAERLMAAGVLPVSGLEEALGAAEIAGKKPFLEPDMALKPGPAPEAPRLLDEAVAKALLAAHGVPVPEGVVCDRAGLGAVTLDGPLALKTLGLAHKSEAGGVRLGLSAADLAQAAADMPGERFLVERMVTGGVAELLMGVTRDPAHGFVLTLGAGGVMTELIGDTASMLVPSGRERVEQALTSLKWGELLRGFRGKPPADMGAIVDAVMRLQAFVAAHADTLDEVEVNPLICTPHGAVAADALIRKG